MYSDFVRHPLNKMEIPIMKLLQYVLILLIATTAVSTVNASDFFGGNNGEWKMGPYGPYWDESDWPEWTPMYWMEEFMDSWDNNGWGGNNYGYYGGNNYNVPYNGSYNNIPYGYGYNAPYYGGYAAPQAPVMPTIPVPAQ